MIGCAEVLGTRAHHTQKWPTKLWQAGHTNCSHLEWEGPLFANTLHDRCRTKCVENHQLHWFASLRIQHWERYRAGVPLYWGKRCDCAFAGDQNVLQWFQDPWQLCESRSINRNQTTTQDVGDQCSWKQWGSDSCCSTVAICSYKEKVPVPTLPALLQPEWCMMGP